jgi:hypothetical protein
MWDEAGPRDGHATATRRPRDGHVLRRAAPCCAATATCCAVVRRASPWCAVLRRAAPCCAVLRRAAPCCAVLRRDGHVARSSSTSAPKNRLPAYSMGTREEWRGKGCVADCDLCSSCSSVEPTGFFFGAQGVK